MTSPDQNTSKHLPFTRKARFWMALLLLLPLMACSVSEGLPFGPTSLPFHPTGRIVYECWPEHRSPHLCLINADGTGYKQLTYQTADKQPAWSPDGKHIVFSREINKLREGYLYSTTLFTINSDGSDIKQFTNISILGESPNWSPDGSNIVFTYSDKANGSLGIATISPEGHVIPITNSSETQPHWSPDGTKIAFVKYIISNNSLTNMYISLMNANGSDQKQLTHMYSNSPAWSPDGTKIAFTCLDQDEMGICLIKRDGSELENIARSGLSPSWSPDGKYIVFYKSDPQCVLCPTSGQLWIMRADGSQQTKLTNGPVDQNPVWGPAP